MTTATAGTWPDAAQLARVSSHVIEACNALDELHLDYWRLATEVDSLDDGTRLPTFEELGQLSAFIASMELDLEVMGKHLEPIRDAHDAAAARMQDAARVKAGYAR
jgi:hypothetical protein